MASAIKYRWIIKKCAKFLNEAEACTIDETEDDTEDLDFSCKGRWKTYSGENKDLVLSYLESDHLLLTKQDVILESFSLPCSKACLRGVAKADSLLMTCQIQGDNVRRFRMQFDAQDNREAIDNRRQCTDLLRKYIKILDHDEKDTFRGESTNVNEFLLDKMKCRKGYSVTVPKESLEEMITLCLTDSTFPAFVAEVDKLLKSIGKA